MTSQEQEDAKVRGDMQRFARFLDKQLPFGWGFVFLAFPFGAGGRMNYVANGDRPDVVRAMYEFIEATKAQWAEHEAPLGAAAEDEQLGRARQRIAELERELDKALESRREWMEKVTVDRSEIAELKVLLSDAADALDRPETRAWRYQWVESLIDKLRKATQ